MRVLGIDPGLRNLGWGVIDVAGARLTHVANGICHSDGAGRDLAARLLNLHSAIDRGVARIMRPMRRRWRIPLSTRTRWRR